MSNYKYSVIYIYILFIYNDDLFICDSDLKFTISMNDFLCYAYYC